MIRDNTLVVAADPTKTYVAPKPDAPVPYLNFAPLQNAVARLKAAARAYDARPRGEASAATDEVLMHAEQALLRPDGLPKRPWFRHQIYAPGFYTGYGVKTIPGVREAIEQKEWSAVAQQMDNAAAALNAYTARIEAATK